MFAGPNKCVELYLLCARGGRGRAPLPAPSPANKPLQASGPRARACHSACLCLGSCGSAQHTQPRDTSHHSSQRCSFDNME